MGRIFFTGCRNEKQLENLVLTTEQHTEPNRLRQPPASAQAQTGHNPKLRQGNTRLHENRIRVNCARHELKKDKVLLHGQDFLHRL
jgi:hypothetical protein